jgi:hypothetical protein
MPFSPGRCFRGSRHRNPLAYYFLRRMYGIRVISSFLSLGWRRAALRNLRLRLGDFFAIR